MNNLTIIIICVFLCSIILTFTNGAQSDKEKDPSKAVVSPSAQLIQLDYIYNPLGPLVSCAFLPLEFLDCDELLDHHGNSTAKELSKGEGCLKFGGVKFEDVERTYRKCHVLTGIECNGTRENIIRHGFPCIRHSDHYFVTTLLYSILLGFIGMDRFCLGQTGTAVGKLLTLGGVGIWWIIDIVLLITNNLMPEDGSNWNPNV